MTTSVTGHCACDPVNNSGTYAAASALRAGAAYSRVSDIVIQTHEGDRVTLSSSNYKAGGYEIYEALAVGKNAATRQFGGSAWFESSRELSLSVTGDLNREESRDVHRILRTLDEMMNDLAAGDLEGALAGASKFTGIDTIASFSADMSITASLDASRYSTATASMPTLPASQGGDSHRAGWIDRAADNFIWELNAKTATIGDFAETLEKHLSDWFNEKPADDEGRNKGMKWASRFARRLMDGFTPTQIEISE